MNKERSNKFWQMLRGKNLPPTEKQLDLLKQLNITDIPLNRYEAGQLIERIVQKGISAMTISERLNQSNPKVDKNILKIVSRYINGEMDFRLSKYLSVLNSFFKSLPTENIDEAPYGFSYHCPSFEMFIRHYVKYLVESQPWIKNRTSPFNPRSVILRHYLEERWPRSECGYKKSLSQYLEEFHL